MEAPQVSKNPEHEPKWRIEFLEMVLGFNSGPGYILFGLNTGGQNGMPSLVHQMYLLVLRIGWPPVLWFSGPVDFNKPIE